MLATQKISGANRREVFQDALRRVVFLSDAKIGLRISPQILCIVLEAMSNSLLSVLLLVTTIGCSVASFLIHVAIIAGINRKRDTRSQLSYLDRDFFGTLDLHRQLYPKSIVRRAQIISLGISVALGLSFALTQSLLH